MRLQDLSHAEPQVCPGIDSAVSGSCQAGGRAEDGAIRCCQVRRLKVISSPPPLRDLESRRRIQIACPQLSRLPGYCPDEAGETSPGTGVSAHSPSCCQCATERRSAAEAWIYIPGNACNTSLFRYDVALTHIERKCAYFANMSLIYRHIRNK